MSRIIYDVAVSVDGYIAGPDGDISAFAEDGPVVEDYRERLSTYTCAIMGRAAYEFGYRFGMKPGVNPYPHVKTYVFSQTLQLPDASDVHIVRGSAIETISNLRAQQTGPVYLCGGGAFAGALMKAGMIDVLRLKRAPIVLGGGTSLFGECDTFQQMTCTETKTYEGGYLFQEFQLEQE